MEGISAGVEVVGMRLVLGVIVGCVVVGRDEAGDLVGVNVLMKIVGGLLGGRLDGWIEEGCDVDSTVEGVSKIVCVLVGAADDDTEGIVVDGFAVDG